jgi:hypothetical protein
MVSNKNDDGGHSVQSVDEVRKDLVTKERKSMGIQRAKWVEPKTIYDDLPAHEKPFNIEPFPNERQRLPFRMTDEDRKRRSVWLESQQLTDREPVYVPELDKMIYNPIRRLYKVPTNKFFDSLVPIVGHEAAPALKFIVPKIFLAWIAGCTIWYNFKYVQPVSVNEPNQVDYFLLIKLLISNFNT